MTLVLGPHLCFLYFCHPFDSVVYIKVIIFINIKNDTNNF